MNLKIKNRNIYYFILSALVILLHNEGYFNYIEEGNNVNTFVITICDILGTALTRVAIPSFLFFSGLLFNKDLDSLENLKRKIKNRLKTVVLPFFMWNIISMIWSYLLSVIPFTKNNIAKRELFTFSLKNIIDGLFFYKYNSHNWFLAQLIIFLVLSPIMYNILKNKKISIIFILTIFGLYLCRIDLPIYLKEFCGIYYFLGCFIGKFYYSNFISYSMNKKHRKWYKILINIVVCICMQLIVFYYLENDYFLVGIPWGIASYCFWLLFNCVDFKDEPAFTKFYYFNFLAHFIVAPCIDKLIWIFLPHNNIIVLFNKFGGTAATMLIIVFVGTIIKKYIKPLWFILTGEKV